MSLVKLPGLIDPHVHLRDPGQTHKEDFYSGSSAALAGGYTTIIDMPNNSTPITSLERLEEKIKIAKEKIVCDVGFYFGSMGDNIEELELVADRVLGLKLYLNQTTGGFSVNIQTFEKILKAWKSAQSLILPSIEVFSKKPVLVHAVDKTLEQVIEVVQKEKYPVHIVHVSSKFELEQVIEAKNDGLPITCGVTPHHLFLTDQDEQRLGPFGMMKPPLRSRKDVDFLWKNLDAIDCIESDHAPHTMDEKEGSDTGLSLRVQKAAGRSNLNGIAASSPTASPRNDGHEQVPYGVPGLETTLPLLLTAMNDELITMNDIIRLCSDGPSDIFGIQQDPKTYSDVDLNSKFLILNSELHTKCGWSPFDGMKVKGKVQRVFIRGKKVFEDGQILASPGSGLILTP